MKIMLPPRAFLAVLVAVALTLAGCVATDDGVEAGTASPASVTSDDSVVIDDAAAESARENASRAAGHLPHVHNYWDGRTSVTLLDTDVTPSTEDVIGETLVTAFLDHDVRGGGTLVRFPDGSIVYEGTGRMIVTATWEDVRVTDLALSFQASNTREFAPPLELENGVALDLEIRPEMTDLPHMSKSRWVLAFAPAKTGGVVAGTFHIKIEIVKLRNVGLFPAHPDLFEGKSEKVIHSADGRSEQVSYAKRTTNLVTQSEFGEDWIISQRLVPAETKSIRATVTLTRADANVGQVSEIRFFYITADSSEIGRTQVVNGSFESGVMEFAIPVRSENVDSPYSLESQWQFLVEAATTVTGNEPTCGGCVDTDIEFHLELVAYDHDYLAPPA